MDENKLNDNIFYLFSIVFQAKENL